MVLSQREERVRIVLFQNSKDLFLSMLDEKGIKYSKVPVRPGAVMGAGITIEIVIPLAALASVLRKWLEAKSRRKIQITKKDRETVHLEAQGYSVKDVEKLLDRVDWIAVIESKDKESGNE
jgi:hypothetical protein